MLFVYQFLFKMSKIGCFNAELSCFSPNLLHYSPQFVEQIRFLFLSFPPSLLLSITLGESDEGKKIEKLLLLFCPGNRVSFPEKI